MPEKSGRARMVSALGTFGRSKEKQKEYISGILGFLIGGNETVEVASRPGYVYVRLRDNMSEVIQAYNTSVSPVYGLPVLVSRDTNDSTRYIIVERDTARYGSWQTSSTYIAVHGNQHSFAPEFGGAGDVVWVYDRQFMPLLVSPSGTSGSGGVIIDKDILYQNGIWMMVGGTGTVSLLPAKPTNNLARMMLVGVDLFGNPWIVSGSTFAATITGSALVLPYLPTTFPGIPLAGIRLVSGTSTIGWDNIYDTRQFFGAFSGSSGGGGGGGGNPGLAIYENNVYKVTGTALVFNDASSIKVSGSFAYVEPAYWRQTVWIDEFNGGVGGLNWSVLVSTQQLAPENKHPGILAVNSDNPGFGRISEITNVGVIVPENVEYMGWIVRGENNLTTITGTYRMGLIFNPGNIRNTATGLYFMIDRQVTGSWSFVANNLGSVTTTPLTTAYVANNWYLFEMKKSGNNFEIWVNNALKTTVSSDFPGAGTELQVVADVYSYDATLALDVDWFGLKTTPETQRWT